MQLCFYRMFLSEASNFFLPAHPFAHRSPRDDKAWLSHTSVNLFCHCARVHHKQVLAGHLVIKQQMCITYGKYLFFFKKYSANGSYMSGLPKLCRARDWSARITTLGIESFLWPDNIRSASQKYSFPEVNPVQVWWVELWQFLQNKGLARTEGLNPRKEWKAKLVHGCTAFPAALVLNGLWITSPTPGSCGKRGQIMGLPSSSAPAAYSAFLWNSRVRQELTIPPASECVPSGAHLSAWASLGTWRFPCDLWGDSRLVPLLQVRECLLTLSNLRVRGEINEAVPESYVKGRRTYLTFGRLYKGERFGCCTVKNVLAPGRMLSRNRSWTGNAAGLLSCHSHLTGFQRSLCEAENPRVWLSGIYITRRRGSKPVLS